LSDVLGQPAERTATRGRGRRASPVQEPPAAAGRLRADTSSGAVRQTLGDFWESWRRVARKTHMPTREGVMAFFGHQVLVNTVAWTGGVVAAGLVRRFFEIRGFWNLWGLASSAGRSPLSVDDYQALMTLASYLAGLVMMVLIRHLVLRVITEFRSLRFERDRVGGACPSAPADPGRTT
jgi:hypothetical protein